MVRSIKAYKVFRRHGKGYLPLFHFCAPVYENEKKSADRMPRWGNLNGWWAFKTRAGARKLAKDYGKAIVRTVRLSGTIMEYEEGYRAEFMKIIPRGKS